MDGWALPGGRPWGTVWVGDGEQTQGEDVGLAQRGLPMGTVTAEGAGHLAGPSRAWAQGRTLSRALVSGRKRGTPGRLAPRAALSSSFLAGVWNLGASL